MAIMNVKQFSRKGAASTPQSQKAHKDQVPNDAGGYTFQVGPWDYLRRFLILGSEGGTYYMTEQDLTKQNHANVIACIKESGRTVVDQVVEVSDKALAPKNDPALFVLALCMAHGDADTKVYARENFNKVVRIGTHLFHFAQYANAFRGWGRSLKNAVASWYLTKDADRLALQAIKYQQRDGWSHRDLLRLTHVKSGDSKQDAVLRWMIGGIDALEKREVVRKTTNTKSKAVRERTENYPSRKRYLPEIISAFEEAKTATTKKLIKLITEHDLPREAIPTEKLNEVEVWEALLENMPVTAMVRNLGKMTSIGLLKSLSAASKKVVQTLGNQDALKKSRIHPMAILIANKIYDQGHGDKGSLNWKPVPAISQALDEAFYLAFGNVRKTGKPLLFALDVSGSMSSSISGCSSLSCCEAATALALVHANVEDDYHVMRFNTGIEDTPIRKGMRLPAALKYTRAINGGGTDCSLPATWARQQKVEIGGVIILTDSETWTGSIHPFQALTAYRKALVKDLRQVVVGMEARPFTIADPTDKLSMDVVGFDASAPNVISSFIAGDLG